MVTYTNPYRMGGYEGCGPDWNGRRCPCVAVAPPRASGPTLGGLSGAVDELDPLPKLALGVALLAGAFVILSALDGRSA